MSRYTPFSILIQQVARFRQVAPQVDRLDMVAWQPGEPVDRTAMDHVSEVAGYGYRKILSALKSLDGTTPLVQDIRGGVRETLRLRGQADRLYLQVENALGERERVAVWYAVAGFEDSYDGWCESRRLSDDLGEAWDLSRRERRVVDYDGRKVIIDPGIVLAVDAIVAMGCRTHHSCEGHPGGGYVAYEGEGTNAVSALMKSSGWSVEPGGDYTVARMPRSICTVQARDRLLRNTANTFLREVPHLSPYAREMTP